MKTSLALLLAALVVPAAALAAGFEGRVTMKLTGPKDAPPSLTFAIKDQLTRIDLLAPGEAGRVAVIMDSPKKEMTILMLDQKMFMRQPLAAGAATLAGDAGAAAAEAVIEKTSVTEKILGYLCTKYVSTVKGTTTEMWVTEELGSFTGLGAGNPLAGGIGAPRARAPSGLTGEPWEKALAGLHAFPLRAVSTTGGKETFRLEVTAIEKQSIPASAFTPPADFQDPMAMMRGLSLPPGMKLPGAP